MIPWLSGGRLAHRITRTMSRIISECYLEGSRAVDRTYQMLPWKVENMPADVVILKRCFRSDKHEGLTPDGMCQVRL